MHLEAVHFFSSGSVTDIAVLLAGLIPTLQPYLTMMPGLSILYPHSTVGLCSPRPIRSVFELAYWGGEPILISEKAAHNYRTPVFVDCEEFPSGLDRSGRIVVPSTGRFILALRHTWGAGSAPRQRHAVATDQAERGAQPGNWPQQGFSWLWVRLLGCELDCLK